MNFAGLIFDVFSVVFHLIVYLFYRRENSLLLGHNRVYILNDVSVNMLWDDESRVFRRVEFRIEFCDELRVEFCVEFCVGF